MKQKQSSVVGRIVRFLIVALVIGLPILGWMNRWKFYDAYRLRGYTPPAQIAQIASDTTMNSKMRNLFYVYHPQLDIKDEFNKNCKTSEKTIVLGCYVDQQGIYLYNVTDDRLQGVLQVTAAHEALHAAYDRLSPSDKTKVNTMILAAYDKVTDERIRATIDDYRKNGADTTNELHSILGTEVRNLPPDLENYYKRYFTNRAAIVTFSEKYEKAFTDRKNQVSAYDTQLDQLKTQIDTIQNGLDDQTKAIDAEKGRLSGLLAAKDYANYNAGVPGYNQKISNYNTQVKQARALIDQYNGVVAARNNIVLEEGELSKAIDSRPSTISQ